MRRRIKTPKSSSSEIESDVSAKKKKTPKMMTKIETPEDESDSSEFSDNEENHNITDKSQYKELDPVEHVIECPDVYMGALKNTQKCLYTYEPKTNKINYEEVVYNTGLLKIFDEILTNASDNLQKRF